MTPVAIKPRAMMDVVALDCTNAVVAAPIPNPAKGLFCVFLNNLLTPFPVDFFKPEDMRLMPTIKIAAPTNNVIILVAKSISLFYNKNKRALEFFLTPY